MPFSVSILVKLSVICLPPYGSLVVPASIIHPMLMKLENSYKVNKKIEKRKMNVKQVECLPSTTGNISI